MVSVELSFDNVVGGSVVVDVVLLLEESILDDLVVGLTIGLTVEEVGDAVELIFVVDDALLDLSTDA